MRFEDNGEGVDAEVLGTDASSDIAVLRVDPSKTGGVKPLALANSDSVQVGDLAVAIGYPLGLDRTATAGIVSGLGRDIKAPNGFSIDKVIQTDAPINPGNSGGPLLDGAGRVIGINSQIATTGGGGGSVGIGFAVPSNTVRQVVPRLRTGSAIRRAYLGISPSPARSARAPRSPTSSPAGRPSQAGLQIGDTITRVGGEEIRAAGGHQRRHREPPPRRRDRHRAAPGGRRPDGAGDARHAPGDRERPLPPPDRSASI